MVSMIANWLWVVAPFCFAAVAPAAEDISFIADVDGSEQKYVQVLPPEFNAEKPVDLLIALHGHGSDRWQFVRQTRDECRAVRAVASQYRMILICPDYRAKTSWMGPKAESDLVQIISELRRRFSVRHVFLCGASMGGASCLTFTALHPELVAGVASMNGLANHLDFENFQDAIRASFCGSKSAIPGEYRKRSAEFWPAKFNMPTAFAVGGKDESVPPDSVLRLAKKLKNADRPTLLIHRQQRGHSTTYEDAVTLLEFVLDRAPQRNAARTPNIVFLLVDDLGWTDLGCFGSDFYQTPQIDRLASEGVRFTNAYAAAPACSPTRAAILTGKYPARLRVTDWIPGITPQDSRMTIPDWTKQLEHGHTTIAEALKKAGYATAHIGKWHLGHSEFYPTRHGFDENIGGSYIGAPGSYYYPYFRKSGLAWGPVENLPDGIEGRYLTDRLADEAVKWIHRHRDQPFFLHLATYSVHTPIQPRADLLQKYQTHAKRGDHHHHPGYAAMVAAVDEAVGKVVRQVQKSGLAENTIIILTSDNGGFLEFTSNTPLRSGKGFPYEGGVRVPLIVKVPNSTWAGTECDKPVISTDFFPTVFDLVGLREDPRGEAKQDGVSFVPLLESPCRRSRIDNQRALFWHYPHYNPIGGVPFGAVRVGRYKLIEFYEDGKRELYDLGDDRGENVDLSCQMPELASKLHSRMTVWRDSVKAQMPTSQPQHD